MNSSVFGIRLVIISALEGRITNSSLFGIPMSNNEQLAIRYSNSNNEQFGIRRNISALEGRITNSSLFGIPMSNNEQLAIRYSNVE